MEEDKQKENTLAHVTNESGKKSAKSYDPDEYVTEGEDFQEGVPLEAQEPDKGYSTDARQGKSPASLHLADEDMDRRPPNPKAQAQHLKESFEKSKKNSDEERAADAQSE